MSFNLMRLLWRMLEFYVYIELESNYYHIWNIDQKRKQGQNVVSTRGKNLRDNICSVFDAKFFNKLQEIKFENEHIK